MNTEGYGVPVSVASGGYSSCGSELTGKPSCGLDNGIETNRDELALSSLERSSLSIVSVEKDSIADSKKPFRSFSSSSSSTPQDCAFLAKSFRMESGEN